MDIERERERLRWLARLMDARFVIPGVGARVGLDGLIGLIPGIGDTAGMLVSAYIVYRGHRLGAPPSLVGRMAANVAIDYLVGSVPVLGDLFDVAFKANMRNVDLLDRWLSEQFAGGATIITPDGTEWHEPPRQRRWG
jgi:hypothetical protein